MNQKQIKLVNKESKNKKGIAALMTVIVAAGIISAIILPLSFQVYLAESRALAGELKEESKFSASSCLSAIILYVAEFGLETTQSLPVSGISNCITHSITVFGSNYIVELESVSGDFHTLLRATIDASSQKTLLYEELKNF